MRSLRASPARPDPAAPPAVLRRPARPRRRQPRPRAGRRSSTSAGGTRRSARRRTWSRRSRAAARADVHGYAPFRGLRACARRSPRATRPLRRRASIPSARWRSCPGRRPRSSSSRSSSRERGDTILLPDPYYPDYPSGVRARRRRARHVPLDPDAGWAPDLDAAPPAAAALFLNYPSNPCAVCAPPGTFEAAVAYAERTGTAIVHDAAYIDLVFDGREPESFLATPGAKDVGVEMWSMSKTYGMAGWRIGFVVGNAEIVERINLHERPLARRHLRAAAARRRSPRSTGRRTGSRSAARPTSAAATGSSPRCRSRPSARARFYVWLRLPDGLTAERLLDEHRVAIAPGEGFGPSGAGWARLSLAVTDEAARARRSSGSQARLRRGPSA